MAKFKSRYKGNNINKKDCYTRAVSISLSNLTSHKQNEIKGIIRAFRQTVNTFIQIMYHSCTNIGSGKNAVYKLNKDTLDLLLPQYNAIKLVNNKPTPSYFGLSERYISQALKQALETLSSIDNSKKELTYQEKYGKRKAQCPKWHGFPLLDSKFVKIRQSAFITHFDWVCQLSTLKDRQPIELPFKGHKVLNKWLSIAEESGSEGGLLQSVELHHDKLILYVQVVPNKGAEIQHIKGDNRTNRELVRDYCINPFNNLKENEIYGFDIGINKLFSMTNTSNPYDLVNPELNKITTSLTNTVCKNKESVKTEGSEIGLYGIWQNAMLDKRLRKKRGSKSFKRATAEYINLINYELKQMFLSLQSQSEGRLRVLIVEGIKHIKFKKSSKKLLLWLCSLCFERLTFMCQENRVLLVKVSPKYTSQQCPFCRTIRKSNRQGDIYVCSCNNVTVDADMNGAFNIRDRFLSYLRE